MIKGSAFVCTKMLPTNIKFPENLNYEFLKFQVSYSSAQQQDPNRELTCSLGKPGCGIHAAILGNRAYFKNDRTQEFQTLF